MPIGVVYSFGTTFLRKNKKKPCNPLILSWRNPRRTRQLSKKSVREQPTCSYSLLSILWTMYSLMIRLHHPPLFIFNPQKRTIGESASPVFYRVSPSPSPAYFIRRFGSQVAICGNTNNKAAVATRLAKKGKTPA